ncbi:MAG: tyrosine-type recombinase/integrase [Thermomicrobiales bacterium]|nr:tyrosine-type recombinase/integrase [Thermomicrobiales bacterium]
MAELHPERLRDRAREGGTPHDLTPYSLRHTCASLMLASGVPLPKVARQLGHSVVETCASIYAHLVDGLEVDGVPLEQRICTAGAA